jgi:hypothetical protein
MMTNRGSHILGIFLLLVGLACLLGGLLITLLDSIGYWNYPKSFLVALFANRDTEQLSFGIQGLQLFHYTIAGTGISSLGAALLAIKRRIIRLVEEITVILKCNKCRNKWQEFMSKTSLFSMDYPKVKSLTRRKCPSCAKFVRPRIVNYMSS